jgi:transposase
MLKRCMRQVFRLKSRVSALGAKGVIHGNRGRLPPNAKPASLRQQVLKLHQTRFSQYNDYRFAETMEEEYGIVVNRETRRRWLRAADIPPKRHHRSLKNRCRKRERRACFGEMLFLDGSPHRWFGPTLPMYTPILATDGTTGRPLLGLSAAQETLAACFEVFYMSPGSSACLEPCTSTGPALSPSPCCRTAANHHDPSRQPMTLSLWSDYDVFAVV